MMLSDTSACLETLRVFRGRQQSKNLESHWGLANCSLATKAKNSTSAKAHRRSQNDSIIFDHKSVTVSRTAS